MNKRTSMLLSLVLGASLLLPAAVSASTASATVGQIQSSVSFRSLPSTSSAVYKYLKPGEQVVILEKVNAYWYKVQSSNGSIGYISSDDKYVDIITGGASNGGSGAVTGNATIVASVSFRTGPSTDSARIRYLSKGETVTITGQPNSYWYAVTASNGTKGYVSSDSQYIKTSGNTSGGSNGGSSGGNSGDTSQAVERVIAAGMKYLGTPYEFGSDRNTTKTFDCSDFTRTAFREGASLILPSDSGGQGKYVRNLGSVKTDWHQLKRGDLMFFMDYKGTKASDYAGINKATADISHVGIYLGNGQILHTYSKESGGVRTSIISGHWEYRFLFGGSAL
ncbi:SH3 domain-containing C40 family peptidase [Paenibacillus sacheonensis]|uniref:SH3 domain-containing protein n=1 Tax=Paenibacillus sacheonensis TaxID=742054 RepID=A0A7X5BZL8_9BACL|nr:SH3 domain-containing C40 family peptidase [Paenibacillus sacheonensis]MBM7567295.1 cell wall-associated NlpC family hydrolase [Paenibacillus sacheonensis]NBC72813.1 SH3 domain-containing protein [Paenibacillus sacheonensis]